MGPDFPAELARHLAESVRAARRRYRKRLARCQQKFSEKAVHELRIETRRILALLDLLEALRLVSPLKKLRKTFKKRLDAFDDLRDTHVQKVLLKPLWAKFPEARMLKQRLGTSEKRLVSELSREIKVTKSRRLNRDLKTIEKSLRCIPATTRSRGLVQMVLDGAFRRVVILRRQIKRAEPATIHRMRVVFKRFRYTAEFLQPFLSYFTPERLARMKSFQGAAGDIQDTTVLLNRLVEDVKSGALPSGSVRKLRAELLQHQRSAVDSFMSRIDELMEFEPKQSVPLAPQPETSPK